MILTSGETAHLQIIPRTEAIRFLAKLVPKRTALGFKIKTTRHNRGPGAAVDILNYALTVAGKTRAVMRIGPAPFGNMPVVAAIGQDLARYGIYLMRLNSAGISADDLQAFVEGCLGRLRSDLVARSRDIRYLVSLDDPHGWLVEASHVFESPPCAGKIYQKVGALSAGFSKTRRQPTRYVDPVTGQLRSIYNAGRNIAGELPPGARLVQTGPKQRFVFVLTRPGSLEYHAWRHALPAHVVELSQDRSLNWVQPRLLIRLGRLFNTSGLYCRMEVQ